MIRDSETEAARPLTVVQGRHEGEAAPSGPLLVSLVEPHELVVVGLTQMLAPYADLIRLVGPGEQEAGLWTDVVLVDPCVRAADTAHVAAVIAGASLGRKLVIYSWAESSDPQVGLARLVADGWPVRGWLSKTLPAGGLVDALVRVHAGQRVVVDRAAGAAIPISRPSPEAAATHVLSPREQEVVTLIVQGLTNQQIADATYLSINSVKTYIRSCYRKMGVTRRSQAVIWGVRHGLDDGHTPSYEMAVSRASS